MAQIKNLWDSMASEEPFTYRPFEDKLRNIYSKERKQSLILQYSALFAGLIACMGLFGLASFSARQRVKEVSIRKVLGASFIDLSFLLTKGFIQMVFYANLIAWPVSYYIIIHWLNQFAYRISYPLWIFPIVTLLSLVISLATVNIRVMKIVKSNPTDTLRFE